MACGDEHQFVSKHHLVWGEHAVRQKSWRHLCATLLLVVFPIPGSTAEILDGTPAADVLVGKGGDSLIRGFGGDDLAFGDPASTTRGILSLSHLSRDPSDYGPIIADPVFSFDGRFIAYTKLERNPNGSMEEYSNVYISSVNGGKPLRVSTSEAGIKANRSALEAAFSPDGKFVAFSSNASNLVRDDTNEVSDIFVKEISSGRIDRISTNSAGEQASTPYCYMLQCGSVRPSFSPDGRYIVFQSNSENLVSGDVNKLDDIFVKDILTGRTTRISTALSGAEANNRSFDPIFSPMGNAVVFASWATNLVPGGSRGRQVFLKDLETGAVTLVSTSSTGRVGNGESLNPSFSADGKKVAFQSIANNLVPGDRNKRYDFFVKDLVSGTTIRVNTTALGQEGAGDYIIAEYAKPATFSPDGLKIAFGTGDPKLVPGHSLSGEVFMKDLKTGSISVISNFEFGYNPTFDSGAPSFSPDGESVVFYGPLLVLGRGHDDRGVLLARLAKGPPGNDRVSGGAGNDRLAGAGGEDSIDAGPGDDLVFGGDDADRLDGGPGTDILIGGAGDDLLASSDGSDDLDGSDGVDRASFEKAPSAVAAKLTEAGVGKASGGVSAFLVRMEGLRGSAFPDRLACAVPACTLEGGPGDDVIVGDRGSRIGQFIEFSSASGPVLADLSAEFSQNMPGRPQTEGRDRLIAVRSIRGTDFRSGDRLIGDGRGNTIEGLGGADQLTGKAGPDIFAYTDTADSPPVAPDTITDFSQVQRDVVDLTAPTFGRLAWIGSRSFSAPGQIRFTVEGATGILEVNSIGGSGAEFRIVLDGVRSLAPKDIRYREE